MRAPQAVPARKSRPLLLRAATGVWMAAVLVASLLPPSLGGRGGAVWHVVGYGVLAALLATWQPVGRAAAFAWGYGLLLELLQGVTPSRSAEVGDLVVNAAAVGVALLVRAALRSARR
ncbi:MAG: hypothetical protein QN210_03530 [Armatimonadota bacterium]|nr:hypothetical protein [Armatimonadota bacterium]MDR7587701.1 hypothetical protein [Armatimonadota bacterium]MDR7611470.1 hypothetical protein [Armatimonadota bacterium]